MVQTSPAMISVPGSVVVTPRPLRARSLPLAADRLCEDDGGETATAIGLDPDGPASIDLPIELARSQAALSESSERLLCAQEEERRRIAVELHDSTCQHLVAIGLGFARLRRILGADTRTGDVLDDMAASLGEAIREIRVNSYLMNPPNLARDGLDDAARRFVHGLGARTGLRATFRSEGALNALPADVRHAAFRVMQEALSNVHRHARATGVDVEMVLRGDIFTLSVADDGAGVGHLDGRSDGPVQLGVGIPGMRARVGQLGGVLDISSSSRGTVVFARFPAQFDKCGAASAQDPGARRAALI
jgi:two-component system, NarL family, sensor kinase